MKDNHKHRLVKISCSLSLSSTYDLKKKKIFARWAEAIGKNKNLDLGSTNRVSGKL